jgi:DNA-directed RNA polymerase subunit RPC12/RpoP
MLRAPNRETRTQIMNEQENIKRYPCPTCGANLVFDPKKGGLSCGYCGYAEQIFVEKDTAIEERPFEEYLRPSADRMQALAADALEVKCDSCGASVTFVPPETARECDFCGAKIVAQPKAADPLVAPEGVLPFAIDKKQAAANVKQWISSRWFAPSALKQFAQPESIHGVYLPYWTYDAYTVSDYTGERGDHYYETEYYTETDANGNQVQQSRQVQKTRWSYASGRFDRWFDDILVCATTSLPENRLNALEPWDLPELKPYEPAFLSGFRAQRYMVDLPSGFEKAKIIAARQIESDARHHIGGDEQRVHNINTNYSSITFKHLLLPVYAGAYRLNGQVYQVVVNGRNGQVQGDRPYSWVKIGCLIAAIIGVIIFFVLLAGLFSAVTR